MDNLIQVCVSVGVFLERLLHLGIEALSYYQQVCYVPHYCAPPHPLPASLVNADVSPCTEYLLAHSLCPFSLSSLLVLVFLFMLVLSFIFLHLILFPSVLFQVHFHPNTFF